MSAHAVAPPLAPGLARLSRELPERNDSDLLAPLLAPARQGRLSAA